MSSGVSKSALTALVAAGVGYLAAPVINGTIDARCSPHAIRKVCSEELATEPDLQDRHVEHRPAERTLAELAPGSRNLDLGTGYFGITPGLTATLTTSGQAALVAG